MSLVDELGGEEAGHSYASTDVSQKDEVRALAAHVERSHGRCDVLVNNAGFSIDRPFDGAPAVNGLQEVMATNFFGAVYCTAELLGLLLESAPSHVVSMASMAGRIAVRRSSYCAAKFALVGWSEALHQELAGRGCS